MARHTLPRKRWSGSLPAGDYRAWCAICGCPWPRSKLVKKSVGLVCPMDNDGGLEAAEASKANARHARAGRVLIPGGGL